MTRRSGAVKGLISVLLAIALTSSLPRAASAQSSPWWPGDPEVILGYGCTSIPLEPYDGRFNCPAWASHVHEGMDIDLPYGTPIYAGWPGIVTEVGGREAHDYGPHYVKIWLDEGHDILLGHLSKATVAPRQRVEIGTLVGYVGDLGVTDIPNLDFGARPHGAGEYQSIDPLPFLPFLDRSQASQSYVGRNPNGRVQVLARSMMDGSAWSMELTGVWTATPGGPDGGFATEPAVTGGGRGHLVAFAVGVDGALWTSPQLASFTARTSWHTWISLGRPAAPASALIGLPALGLGPDGRLHAFVRAADGTLWEARQSRAGGRWSKWDRTPFASQVAGDPVAASDSTGALQVFVPSTDGRILANRQAQGGGAWTGWHPMDRTAGGEAGLTKIAVLRDAAGLLEAFVVTGDGSLFASTQSRVDRWMPWSRISWRSHSGLADVAAVLRPDRRVQVFGLNTFGVLLTTIRQGRTWSPWTTLGHGLSGGIATTFGVDGSLLVLAGSNENTFAARSGDPQEFDRRTQGPLEADELSQLRAQAWTPLPALPRTRNLGPQVGLL